MTYVFKSSRKDEEGLFMVLTHNDTRDLVITICRRNPDKPGRWNGDELAQFTVREGDIKELRSAIY